MSVSARTRGRAGIRQNDSGSIAARERKTMFFREPSRTRFMHHHADPLCGQL